MEKVMISIIILGSISGLTEGLGVLPDGPLNAAVDGTFLFTTSLTPTEQPFQTVSWSFNGNNIITSRPDSNTTSPEYVDRITLFPSTGSLELRSLTEADNGEYNVTIQPATGAALSGSTTLNIYATEPVSNIAVLPKSADVVEFSSVSLSCTATGSSISFLWLNDTSEVTANDRVNLTDGGSTLTVNVTRYDQQPFRCHVFNPVSNDTSDPVNITVGFGPENTNLLVSPSEEYFAEGSDIRLFCSTESRPPAQFLWFLNGESLLHTEPELILTNIQMNNTGSYRCQAFNNKTMRNDISEPIAISVLVPVSNVAVLPKSADVVEFSSVSLSCSATGSSISFLWLNDTSEVTASDRVHLTDGNSTLTIVNVSRYDQQPFRCHVFNSVSKDTSDPVNIIVSFGPENTNLLLTPSGEYFAEGSDVRLFCSTASRPPAHFLWFLNGERLLHTEPELILTNIQMNNTGNYSCQAINDKTMRNDISQPSAITVLENISGASVKPSITQIIEGTSVNLTCEASGSIWTRMWKKNGLDLILADNMILSDDNSLLSFNPVKINDNGEYFCNISNPVSSDGAKHDLVVNYGPENVQITGPTSIKVGSNLKLICSADSTPSASYTWKLSGTTILSNSHEYMKENVEISDKGSYTCEARNSITERSSLAVHELSVTEQVCSAGCIAGIVIACCVVVAGAVGVGFYIYRKKKHPKTSSKRNTSRGDEGQHNTGYSSEEVNYADVRFLRNKNGGEVQVGLQNTSSDYAEVRVNNGPPNYDAHMQRVKRQAPQPDANGEQS